MILKPHSPSVLVYTHLQMAGIITKSFHSCSLIFSIIRIMLNNREMSVCLFTFFCPSDFSFCLPVCLSLCQLVCLSVCKYFCLIVTSIQRCSHGSWANPYSMLVSTKKEYLWPSLELKVKGHGHNMKKVKTAWECDTEKSCGLFKKIVVRWPKALPRTE